MSPQSKKTAKAAKTTKAATQKKKAAAPKKAAATEKKTAAAPKKAPAAEKKAAAPKTPPKPSTVEDHLGEDNDQRILQKTRVGAAMRNAVMRDRLSITEKLVSEPKSEDSDAVLVDEVPEFSEAESELIEHSMASFIVKKRKEYRVAKLAADPKLKEAYQAACDKVRSASSTRGVGAGIDHNAICTGIDAKFFEDFEEPSAENPQDVLDCLPRCTLWGLGAEIVSRVVDRTFVYAISCAIRNFLLASQKAQINYVAGPEDVGPAYLFQTAAAKAAEYAKARAADADLPKYQMKMSGAVGKYIKTAIARVLEDADDATSERLARPNVSSTFREIVDRAVCMFIDGVSQSIAAGCRMNHTYNVSADSVQRVLLAAVVGYDTDNAAEGEALVRDCIRLATATE